MIDIIHQALAYPILVPAAAGLLCFLLPRFAGRAASWLAVLGSAATVGFAWSVFTADPMVYDLEPWINLRSDKLAGFILLAAAVFGLLLSLYSAGYFREARLQRSYYGYFMLTLSASCGVLLANNFIVFLVFWGFLGLTLYMLIGMNGPSASAAAKKSFIIIGGSDCLLILGVAILFKITGSVRMDSAPVVLNGPLAYTAFIGLAIGAFAKAGAMPFHTWLPDCGEKAPVSVTAFLPASLDKLLGVYLLARIAVQMFALDHAMALFLQMTGAVTIICAVMMALVQHDMKRLLSYHAVSQVGYMVLGIGMANPVGLAGALFHMLNHAVYKSCLFMSAGSVELKTGTADLDRMGGLARIMPVTFAGFFIAAMSISGIPPLNGFASKWMIYQGIIDAGSAGSGLWPLWLAVAMFGSALTLASFVKVMHAVFLRKPPASEAARPRGEMGLSLWLPIAVLALLCVVFGIFARSLPLEKAVFPAINNTVVPSGVWWSGTATILILAAFLLGAIIYFIFSRSKARVCPTYIGGEIMDQAYISGLPAGKSRDLEVTGVDFYRTVQEWGPLKGPYRAAERKFFDIYEVGTAFIFYFVEMLRKAHNGVLRQYLVWVVAGLMFVMLVLLYGAR